VVRTFSRAVLFKAVAQVSIELRHHFQADKSADTPSIENNCAVNP
jgi:hypothetical protein